MRFGNFMAPFHPTGQNPTLAIDRDLDLIVAMDRLGFHEAWIGEHHSAGFEIIASPEIVIATAAERTKHIKLGTGVSSLPYHHPLMLADRMVLLDHLTRGRVMLGCGPGQLSSDAHMLGIPADDQRPRMEQCLDAIMRLLRGETVTMHTDGFTLQDARLQLRPYSDPCFDIAVAATFSPPAPAERAGTASECSRSPRPHAREWTYSPSTGRHGKRSRPNTVTSPIGPNGASSGRCTWLRHASRPNATSNTESSNSQSISAICYRVARCRAGL